MRKIRQGDKIDRPSEEKAGTKERKDRECNAVEIWKNRQETFSRVTNERVQSCVKDLQRRRWKRNRRRVECQKPSMIPQTDAKSPLRSYNRLIQFRRKPPEMAWLEILRAVTLMISAYGAMKKRGCLMERLTFRNVMDQYRVAVNTTERGADSTAINVNYNYKEYTVSKSISVPADAIKIMQKNENFRTHQDIMTIYTIMMNLPIFQNNYTYQQCWTLAKNLRYMRSEAKRVLMLRNRNPILVYFIYSGVVNIVVELEGNQLFANPKRIIPLTRGACIGYKAKSPLCICATNCEFLTIDKSVYIKEGIHAVQTLEMEKRFSFFRNWPPLEEWSDNAIYDIASISYTDSYSSGTMILEDSRDEASDIVWFVLKGIMDVVKVARRQMCEKVKAVRESQLRSDRRQSKAKFLDCTLKKIVNKEDAGRGVCREPSRETNSLLASSLKSVTNLLLEDRQTESLKRQELVRRPIYLKMRSLLPGECYGLDNMSELKGSLNKTTNRFCLVSRDCIVIRVSCSQFMDLIRILGIDHEALEKTVHNYAADVEICAMMEDELKWKKYKQKTVESQVLCAPNQKKKQNFTQHLLNMPEIINTYNQPDYLRPLKFVRPGGSVIVNPFYLEVSERPESDAKRGRCLSNSIPSV